MESYFEWQEIDIYWMSNQFEISSKYFELYTTKCSKKKIKWTW